MIGVGRGLVAAVVGLVVVLALLGVGRPAWVTATACAGALAVATARRAAADGVEAFGPADLITLTRAALACAVAGLVADALVGQGGGGGAEVVGALVPMAAVALALDFVDGRVARRTRTASAFGARLDGEADAFLILVLSAYVTRSAGAWVLALGLIRYAYAVVAWVVPWMQLPLPPRYWRKVVAAFTGIALLVAASGYAPAGVTYAGLVVAAVLLAESFGWDVVWLWRGRREEVNRGRPRSVRTGKALERNR